MNQVNRRYEKALDTLARPALPTEVKHHRSSVRLPRRVGIMLRLIGGHIRTCYQQFDGSIELADVCKCEVDWEPMRVTFRTDCEIDEHKLLARRGQDD